MIFWISVDSSDSGPCIYKLNRLIQLYSKIQLFHAKRAIDFRVYRIIINALYLCYIFQSQRCAKLRLGGNR